jgi:hypothetical protein
MSIHSLNGSMSRKEIFGDRLETGSATTTDKFFRPFDQVSIRAAVRG